MVKSQIAFSDFGKLDLRVGEIKVAVSVTDSSKLVEMQVDLGNEIGRRTIYAGIKAWYEPSSLIGRKLIFCVNLAPKKFKINGNEYTSEGMLIAAGADRAYLYSFDQDLPNGTVLR